MALLSKALTETVGLSDTTTPKLDPKRWISAIAGDASVDANWSDGSAPSTGDDVVFDSSGTGDCDWDITDIVGDVTIDTGYTGTVSNSALMSMQKFTQRDGTFAQGNVINYNDDFSLEGGAHTPDQSYATNYYGNFTKTGGTWATNTGQIIMWTDGAEMAADANVLCSHLGFRGNCTVKDSTGYFRCITEFYIIDKTLTIDNSQVRIYDSALANITYAGSPVINGVNGGILQFATASDRVLDSDIYYFDINCDCEFLCISGCGAQRTITLGTHFLIDHANSIRIFSEDATYACVVYTYYGGVWRTIECGDFTADTRGAIEAGTSKFYCYGDWDVYNSTHITNDTGGCTVYFYKDGMTIHGSGYFKRIKHYVFATTGMTCTFINAVNEAMTCPDGGTITGDGCTLELGDSRLYCYFHSTYQKFYGTGTVHSDRINWNYAGTAFVFYALYPTYSATNIHHDGWTMNCDIWISPERSVSYTSEFTLAGNITAEGAHQIRISPAGYSPPTYGGSQGDTDGYTLTCGQFICTNVGFLWLYLRDSDVYVSGSCYFYPANLLIYRGTSHLILQGSGALSFRPGSQHFYDVTISDSTYTLYDNGWVHGDRLGVLFVQNGYHLTTVREYQEAVSLSDETTKGFWLALSDGLSLSETITKDIWKRFTEALGLTQTVSTEISFVPEIEVGWLGSFGRPSYASLTIQLTEAETGGTISGAVVTATIERPDTGATYTTLTLSETSVAGIYKGIFRVGRKDPTGSYPVTIRIVAGINRATQTGYITIYAGAATSIRYY